MVTRGDRTRCQFSTPLDVRIETLPLIIGALVALLGVGIIFDAWTPDVMSVSRERRRRPRVERHRNGEALIGLGVLALAAAFIGRDSWRYSVLVVIVGAVFLVVGAILNRGYVRELFVNRGQLRRRETVPDADVLTPAAADPPVPVERDVTADRMVGDADDPNWNGVERRKNPRGTDGRAGARHEPKSPRNRTA